MMDCDTTGIEPDFSLVKFKKLVGGGSMQIVNLTIPRALRKLGYAEETDRGDRRVHRRQGPRHRRAGAQARALRGLRHRHGRAGDQPDGPRADDGGGAAVPLRGHLQDGQPARDGDRRGDRGRLLPGLEAGPQGAGRLPRQLQGRPAAVGCQGDKPRTQPRGAAAAARPVVEKVIEYRPVRKRLPKRPSPDHLVLGRRRRGLPHRGVLPRRRASARCSSSSASRARPWPA
jgi:ribonucleoside-diphosphate reductase alpha chain